MSSLRLIQGLPAASALEMSSAFTITNSAKDEPPATAPNGAPPAGAPKPPDSKAVVPAYPARLAAARNPLVPVRNNTPGNNGTYPVPERLLSEGIRLATDPDRFSDEQRERLRNELVRVLISSKKSQAAAAEKTQADMAARGEILKSLGQVIVPKEVRAQTLKALSIRELLNRQPAKNNGCILEGPPGTGKTVLGRAYLDVFKKMGAHALEVSEAELTGPNVGSKAQALDKVLKAAVEEARKRGLPSYILLDEATTTVSKPESSSLKGYYTEALDTLKRYIGNYPELIVFITTNGEVSQFEPALIREMRLDVIRLGYPGLDEKTQLWKLYLGQYGLIYLSPEQYRELAESMPASTQGAGIEKFCKGYIDKLIEAEELKRGYVDTLDVLIDGAELKAEDVRHLITYDKLLADVKAMKASGPSTPTTEKGFVERMPAGFYSESEKDAFVNAWRTRKLRLA